MHNHLSFSCPAPFKHVVAGTYTNLAAIKVVSGSFEANATTVENRASFEGLKPGTYTVTAQRLDTEGKPIGDPEVQTIEVAKGGEDFFTLDLG